MLQAGNYQGASQYNNDMNNKFPQFKHCSFLVYKVILVGEKVEIPLGVIMRGKGCYRAGRLYHSGLNR